jgi:protein dpy-30
VVEQADNGEAGYDDQDEVSVVDACIPCMRVRLNSLLRHPAPPALTLAPPQGKSSEKAALAVQNKMNVQSLPIRAYLDQTVVPILLQGMSQLVKER